MPRPAKPVRRMLSVGEVAARVGMSEDYILAEIARGHLKAHKFGRDYRIEDEAFDRWKDSKEYRCVA